MRRVVLAVLAVLTLVVAGCTTNSGGVRVHEGAGQGDTPRRGGTLTAAIPGDPTTIDWGLNTDALTIDIGQNIFELLFAPDRQFVSRPMLATGYRTSNGGRRYTIGLRSGVKFQNGQPMTSKDVVASIQRWFAVSGEGQTVKKDVTAVQAPDAHTVVFVLKKPRYSLISSLAAFVQPCIIMPASIAKAAGKTSLTDAQLIGTGPYEFTRYVHNQYVELSRFPRYRPRSENWGGLGGHKVAYIDHLKFQVVTDSTQRLNGLTTGQWQFAASLDLDSVYQVSADDSLTGYAEANSLIEFALLNSGRGVFRNPLARQALNLTMDKPALAAATLGSSELYSPLRGAFAFADNKVMYSSAGTDVYRAHDLAKAKQLFAKAGVRPGTTLKILTTHTYENYYQLAVVLQAQLKQVGLNATLQVYDFPTMISKLTEQPNSWNISMTSFAGEPLNPSQLLFLSPTWPGGFKSNSIDALMSQYNASTSADQARGVLNRLQAAVWRELPDIAIGKQVLLSAATTQLKNYQNFIGQGFWNAYLAK